MFSITSLFSSVPSTLGMLGALRDGIGTALDWLTGVLKDLFSWVVDTAVWLGGLLDPVTEIFTGIWPQALAAAAAIVLLRMFRWLVLLWRGRTPQVQISAFAWAASNEGDREAIWVTSLFREQLGALRLDALDPLPERAPGAPLVEIVEGVGQGVGRNLEIGKALGKLYRAIWPDAAYEVWGTLRPHPDGGGRISVQLVDRRHRNRTLINLALEETDWEEGAREAAMAVAGALYPRVRKSDRGPWTMWKEAVPRELMAAYHAARVHEEENRLEHAMDRYHAALDRDPLNPNLRLKIAMLQERLELDLDAWFTYEAIVDESDRRAWRGPNRRIYLLAHYRLAILLSNRRVAEQWMKSDSAKNGHRTQRDTERCELRRDLQPSLEGNRLLTKRRSLPSPDRLVTTPAAGLIAELRTTGGQEKSREAMLKPFKPWGKESPCRRTRREQLIKAVLQIVSLQHLEELDAWLRVRPPWRPRQWWDWWVHRPAMTQWLSRREFSRSAVRISKLLVRIRIVTSLERRYCDPPHADEAQIFRFRKAHRRLTRRWPFPPANPWRHIIHFLAPRRRWTNHRDDAWQLHYNAACTAASVLRDDDDDSTLSRFKTEELKTKQRRPLPGETTEGKIIDRAIDELEDYAYRAGSARVATQADWLAIDDPDLKGLRGEPRFTLWASHHLPRGLPPDKPSRMVDVKRFTVRVVHEGACAFAGAWRTRADTIEASSADLAIWWTEERRAWEMLRTSCHEHRSWSERLNGLKALQAWLGATGRADLAHFGHEARGDTARSEGLADLLLPQLVELVGKRPTPNGNGSGPTGLTTTVLPWVDGRVEHVRTAYETGEAKADSSGSLLASVERREALRAFRIWSGLADALAVELHGAPRGSEAPLDNRLDRIRELLPKEPDPGLVRTR